ncbi:MAG: DPP IV N-terminal domain-containing protein [Rhodothermales bacterium]
MSGFRKAALLAAIIALPAVPVNAQEQVTEADYARAESMLRNTTSSLVFSASVSPDWLPDERFTYRNTIPGGAEFILVDPAKKTRKRAFDHDKLAAALSAVSDTTYSAIGLPFWSFEFSDDGRAITFSVGRDAFTCTIRKYTCEESESAGPRMPTGRAAFMAQRSQSVSPDGKKAVFIRDNNLWVRDTETKAERQLTTDGIEDFGYATNNAGWTRSDGPVVLWSPNSHKVATFQHDARGVGMMYLVNTQVGHPELQAWRYPLPEDSVIFRISRVIIDVDTGEMVRLKMPPDQHRSTTSDHIAGRGGRFLDVEWSADESQLAFVSSSRDHKRATLRVADPKTGDVRDVLEEVEETFFESGYSDQNWRVLKNSNEVLWYSQRDNWGHLYLYDLATGQLKQQITSGDWNVLDLYRVDEQNRRLYFTGSGREEGDPYFQYFYSVNFDGSDLKLLTPDKGHHSITLSPSGKYFIDSYSTPVVPPVIKLRDENGKELVQLEKADISRLVAMGWQPPTPVKVKARDGETDIYGLMYKPTNFDPNKKYPILNYLYPGPQTGSVGTRSFVSSRSDKQALAELGFIVVEVDAMGTPGRSKAFHEYYYGNMGDNGIPDQIAAIRQLAAQNSWMDLDKVGIWGHSGGGFASTRAILAYPDFYKVAVSGAGNHDNRNYEDDWGEKWQGLLVENEDGTTNYDNQANQLLAGNLKGKLLIAHGTMDSNVPPSNTMLMVDALVKANKDFDLVMMPNWSHGFGNSDYFMRRRWDYFVKNLLGVDPPKEYEFGKLNSVDIMQPGG